MMLDCRCPELQLYSLCLVACPGRRSFNSPHAHSLNPDLTKQASCSHSGMRTHRGHCVVLKTSPRAPCKGTSGCPGVHVAGGVDPCAVSVEPLPGRGLAGRRTCCRMVSHSAARPCETLLSNYLPSDAVPGHRRGESQVGRSLFKDEEPRLGAKG